MFHVKRADPEAAYPRQELGPFPFVQLGTSFAPYASARLSEDAADVAARE
jgi:hypothetical protein